jgi:3-oxoacyl-[acyl-carrier protein] reductase
MFAEAVSGGHEVGVLVNNAGTYYGCELGKVPEEQFDYVMGVNLKAAFILSQLCLEHMKPYGRGRIINISSIGVKYGGSPSSAVYSMSKAALEAMTMAFAKAGAPRDILVNALRAGVTDTQRHSADKSKDMKRRAGLVPLGRMARPEEIAESILFLASEKSSFTTGSILTAGGGE